MMNWKDLVGNGRDIIEVLSQHLPLETEQNTKISVNTLGIPGEIRNDYLPDRRQER
jgi:hypothetical protein